MSDEEDPQDKESEEEPEVSPDELRIRLEAEVIREEWRERDDDG